MGELFNSMAGTKMKHVAYRGNGPATVALMAGDIQVMFDIVPNALSFGSSGKVRPLAVTSKTRSANFPNLPTIDESGVPNFESTPWQCFLLPKGAQASLVQQWLEATKKALADKEVHKQLTAQGFEPLGSSPEELAAFMERESVKWGKVIADARITGD